MSTDPQSPRSVLIVGADISGSFLKGRYFEDALDFMAHYIYGHLRGLGGLEVPYALFVGSIGGIKADEPKTLFPIQYFENESIAGIRAKLARIFPKNKMNPFTDYNAFFNQVSATIQNRKLILKPISIVLLSDGILDMPGTRDENFKKINLSSLENLSRSVTLRLLYTDAVIGMGWQTKVPRKRVRVWTQDAAVMIGWRDPKIMLHGKSFGDQERFFRWIHENVDFGVRSQRIN